jgi:hypothetical protein
MQQPVRGATTCGLLRLRRLRREKLLLHQWRCWYMHLGRQLVHIRRQHPRAAECVQLTLDGAAVLLLHWWRLQQHCQQLRPLPSAPAALTAAARSAASVSSAAFTASTSSLASCRRPVVCCRVRQACTRRHRVRCSRHVLLNNRMSAVKAGPLCEKPSHHEIFHAPNAKRRPTHRRMGPAREGQLSREAPGAFEHA